MKCYVHRNGNRVIDVNLAAIRRKTSPVLTGLKPYDLGDQDDAKLGRARGLFAGGANLRNPGRYPIHKGGKRSRQSLRRAGG